MNIIEGNSTSDYEHKEKQLNQDIKEFDENQSKGLIRVDGNKNS